MNVLFLTLININSINERNIYTDLLREFIKDGHSISIISPIERRGKCENYLIKEEKCTICKVRTGRIQKTNYIEKGISTLLIEKQFTNAIRAFFSNTKFDLVLYSTPPITLCKAVEFVKKRDNALSCLMLKDIFPQNSVDLGVLSTKGLKGLVYRYFRKKEKDLYCLSDYIGCMSPANVEYLITHNTIKPEKAFVCPNCIFVEDNRITEKQKEEIRRKYGLPTDRNIFLYGGNLGRPQSVDYIVECLNACKYEDAFFLIVGNGTDYKKIENYIKESKSVNVKLLQALPKSEYERLVSSCDVGLIFLDYRFTIPNFPSRLLSYLNARIPVIVASDSVCDMGRIAQRNNFGVSVESNSVEQFVKAIKDFNDTCEKDVMGENGYSFLKNNYSSIVAYNEIKKRLNLL